MSDRISVIRILCFWALAVVAGQTVVQCAPATSVFPAHDWELPPKGAPVSSSEKVDEAITRLRSITGEEGASGALVIQNGYLLWAGDRVDEKRPIWSCTKSILSTCLGLLWDDGKCSPDDLASKYLPELSKDYPEVTLRHLATFTSGLQLDQYSLMFGHPRYPVGTAMHYSYESDLLAYILTRIAGEPLRDLFKRRIADPIGMAPESWEWKSIRTRDGLVINGGAGSPENGMHMTARALARFGWLYANHGNWDGRQLISERYIDYATTPLVDSHTQPYEPEGWYIGLPGIYGLNWWTNGIDAKGKRLWPDVPAKAFAAQGNKNNICIIVPEWKLVFVRTGQDKIIDVKAYAGPLAILGRNQAAH